jgi:hypothetical protein
MVNIYKNFPSGINWSEFSFAEYYKAEKEILEPQLAALGYKDMKWSTGERDSFGPLSRVCECMDSEGNTVKLIYG